MHKQIAHEIALRLANGNFPTYALLFEQALDLFDGGHDAATVEHILSVRG